MRLNTTHSEIACNYLAQSARTTSPVTWPLNGLMEWLANRSAAVRVELNYARAKHFNETEDVVYVDVDNG